MTYEEAIRATEEEFDLRYLSPCCQAIRLPDYTYNGATFFHICICDDNGEALLTDKGYTSNVFYDVSKSEWMDLCEGHGFEFRHRRIFRPYKGISDLYDFINFLDYVSDLFEGLDGGGW